MCAGMFLGDVQNLLWVIFHWKLGTSVRVLDKFSLREYGILIGNSFSKGFFCTYTSTSLDWAEVVAVSVSKIEHKYSTMRSFDRADSLLVLAFLSPSMKNGMLNRTWRVAFT